MRWVGIPAPNNYMTLDQRASKPLFCLFVVFFFCCFFFLCKRGIIVKLSSGCQGLNKVSICTECSLGMNGGTSVDNGGLEWGEIREYGETDWGPNGREGLFIFLCSSLSLPPWPGVCPLFKPRGQHYPWHCMAGQRGSCFSLPLWALDTHWQIVM